jgi:hypothetical protein
VGTPHAVMLSKLADISVSRLNWWVINAFFLLMQ